MLLVRKIRQIAKAGRSRLLPSSTRPGSLIKGQAVSQAGSGFHAQPGERG
jgi:hypothetical protein